MTKPIQAYDIMLLLNRRITKAQFQEEYRKIRTWCFYKNNQ